MNKLLLFTLFALLATAIAQTAVASVHNDCGSQCSSNTTCCGSDSDCSGNAISQRCCPKSSGFCGCISNRAFCQGSVFGDSSRVTGEDTFGTCFDTSKGSCTYNPGPNLWIVCPNGFTACESSSFYTCCNSSQVCTSTQANSYPVCSAASSVAPSSAQPAPSASNICAGKCGSQACCPTPAGSQCYDSANYGCPSDSLGNSYLCPKGLSTCAGACYDSTKYRCTNGQQLLRVR